MRVDDDDLHVEFSRQTNVRHFPDPIQFDVQFSARSAKNMTALVNTVY